MTTTIRPHPRLRRVAEAASRPECWIEVDRTDDGSRSIRNAIQALMIVPDDSDLLAGLVPSQSSDPQLDDDIAEEVARFWDS